MINSTEEFKNWYNNLDRTPRNIQDTSSIDVNGI